MLPVSDAKRIDCIYRKNSDRLFQKLRPGGDFSLFHTEIIAEDTAVDGSKRKTVREQEQQGFACRFFQQRTCDIMRIVLRKKHKNHREKNSINHRSKKKQVCFFFFPFSNVTGNMSGKRSLDSGACYGNPQCIDRENELIQPDICFAEGVT